MRTIVTILSAASLAACTAAPGGNEAAPAPVSNAANAAAPADDEAAGLARIRSEWLEACIGGGRDAAPPGTPVDRHCACAIDRVMAGKTLAEVREERSSGAYRARFSAEMRTCIREIPS